MESNIIGGSNVYPCKGKPVCDQEFVDQVEDYEYIKIIRKKQEIRQTSVRLTDGNGNEMLLCRKGSLLGICQRTGNPVQVYRRQMPADQEMQSRIYSSAKKILENDGRDKSLVWAS